MIAQRDTALEIVEDDENQECENENYHTGTSENPNQEVGISIGEESVTQKYFNGNRAVKLTKLNVGKKKKSPLMNANKPLVKYENSKINFLNIFRKKYIQRLSLYL